MERPSLLGLIVAAFIGGTAAFSWSLSAWIAFDKADSADTAASAPGRSPTVVSNAGDTGAVRLPVEVLPETIGHDD